MKKGYLIVTLKEEDEVNVSDEITVKLVKIRGKQIRLGFSAPKEIRIERQPKRALAHNKGE